jgi:FkbM family methyltransferase
MEIFHRFIEIVGSVDNPVIFEFGTCDGQHTNIMCSILKQMNKDFKYHAFEGDSRIIPNFWRNNANHVMNIKLNEAAIGNIDGEVTFNLSGGVESREGHFKQEFYGSSSIKQPKKTNEYWPDMTFQESIVKCYKFDTYYNEVNPGIIDFIWSDIQGAEKELIEGGQEALAKTRYLYTEYNQGDSYEGEISLSEIIDKLPGSWSIVEDYGHDVLLKNDLYN